MEIDAAMPPLVARAGHHIIWYDGPVMFWMIAEEVDLLAMATTLEPGIDHVALAMSEAELRRYFAGEVDLRSLMLAADARIFLFDSAKPLEPGVFELLPISGRPAEDVLPEPGVFWADRF